MHRYPDLEIATREPALAWLRGARLASAQADGAGEGPGFLAAAQSAEALDAWLAGGGRLTDLEDRSAAGESIAARALAAVHATVVAMAGATVGAPRASVRERLLRSAEQASSGGGRGARPPSVDAAAAPMSAVVTVGRKHAGRADDAARAAAIVRLDADRRGGDAELERLLARVEAWLDFPLLVVSVVHAGETVHRAFRTALSDPPRVVPREASYCTHCVAGDGPLVVEDARRDPFFSQHPAVAAFGLVAYCGVPLRIAIGTPGEAVVGTLCGYDIRPRPILVEDAATLEIFARRVASIVERSTHPDGVHDPSWSDAGSRGEPLEVLAPGPLRDLALVALRRAARPDGDRCALLVGPVVASIPHDEALLGEEGLGAEGFAIAAGRLADGRSAWLVRARSERAASAIDGFAARLAARVGARLQAPVGFDVVASDVVASKEGHAGSAGGPPDGDADVEAWIRRAAQAAAR